MADQNPTPTPAVTTQPTTAAPTPEPTVPMFAPDGKLADIPVSRQNDAAVKGGYKLGINMVGPDGKDAIIPTDRTYDAINKGGYKPKDPNQPLYERAMQYSMGGMPQFVDVPYGMKAQFEQAGRKGNETGSEIGMGMVAGAGGVAAASDILGELALRHLAGEVLPDLMTNAGEEGTEIAFQNAKAKLLEAAPKVYQAAKVLGGLAAGGGGLAALWHYALGNGGK